ncbi:MAG: TetR/AcrR family transcriptional regulator [Tannerella sp.]|jgi:AcrR family transcriptional regulator|nr:TetR/AcrR family transcriptional regulator [Tannerella sp.]
MINKELRSEQIILEAAEAEFLEKGYGNAKMMAIARRADVSHSMLHYYFRSKENLFKTIFHRKIQMLSQLFEGVKGRELPFEETVRLFIEGQFNFVAQNPRMPRFVLNEVITNPENLALVMDAVRPKIEEIFGNLSKLLDDGIASGAIRPVLFRDFIMNIVSLNISTFVSLPVIEKILPGMDAKAKEAYLSERRESNVQFILSALRP